MIRNKGVSVIVCCYNSAAKITPTLNHIFAQSTMNGRLWEVLLIDNNCTDETVKTAKEVHNKSNSSAVFSIIREPLPGLMHARKRGIASSQYELMLFIDDDNWVSPDYLELCVENMDQHPNTAVLGGKGSPVSDSKPFWFDQYAGSFAVGKQGATSGIVPFVYGAGMCIRYSAWAMLEKSKFQSLLLGRTGKDLTSGEDTEICYGLRLSGFDIRYDERLTFKHDLPMQRLDWKYLKRLFFGFGLAKARLDIYASALDNTPLPKDGRLPFWLNRIVFLGKQLRPNILLLLKGKFSTMEGDYKLLQSIATLGQIKGIWQLRHNYTELYQSVAQLQKRTGNN